MVVADFEAGRQSSVDKEEVDFVLLWQQQKKESPL